METQLTSVDLIGTSQNHSSSIGELMAALAKAQGEIVSGIKNKSNPFFKSKFLDLAAVWEVIRKPLSSHGLSVVQTVEGTTEQLYLLTILGHSSGQWIKSKMPLILVKKTPQEMGSSISYSRRYSLMALIGVCAEDEDDDGEAATKPHRKESKKQENGNPPEPDVTQEEVDAYIDANFPNHRQQFIGYMNATKAHYKWATYRETLDQFTQHKDQVKKEFGEWIKKNPS